MKKTITPFTAQLVTYETTLPFKDVIARLDAEVNKTGSLGFMSRLRTAASKADIVGLVNGITDDRDFLYFLEINHHGWLSTYQGTHNPPAVIYTIGNPLIAETILRHDIRTGLNIPPRLMVIESADGSGTRVLYHLPSSLVVGESGEELRKAIQPLDDKLEKLVTRITTESPRSSI
ncbi:hypothetical protein DXG03_002891 [Asterophora parasitica]|uniref:DUF302 domain-containing protein n=1 Tax=Asterophora parasitica TaxID=117018 RepID=A0A9P7GGH9_9AGAR|nr:hypothetical protein DXG03_002891 [Asterophora parasitica]